MQTEVGNLYLYLFFIQCTSTIGRKPDNRNRHYAWIISRYILYYYIIRSFMTQTSVIRMNRQFIIVCSYRHRTCRRGFFPSCLCRAGSRLSYNSGCIGKSKIGRRALPYTCRNIVSCRKSRTIDSNGIYNRTCCIFQQITGFLIRSYSTGSYSENTLCRNGICIIHAGSLP